MSKQVFLKKLNRKLKKKLNRKQNIHNPNITTEKVSKVKPVLILISNDTKLFINSLILKKKHINNILINLKK